jgi:hypothetical protein
MVNELFTVLRSLYWCRDGILAIVSYIKRVNYATDCLEFSWPLPVFERCFFALLFRSGREADRIYLLAVNHSPYALL